MEYIILGDPTPWARAAQNKYGKMYDTQKAVKYVIQSRIKETHGDRPFFKGPLEMNMTFYIKPPRTPFKRHDDCMRNVYHWTRPDLDNLEKLIQDICTGVLYQDDSQVSQVFKKKIYDENPRTVFTVKELL